MTREPLSAAAAKSEKDGFSGRSEIKTQPERAVLSAVAKFTC
jgi:hypothetical protein